MDETRLPDFLKHVLSTRRRVAEDMMRRRNVVACGVGYKMRGDEMTDEPSITVSVTKKMPVEALTEEDIVPSTVEDVPTDVVETGEIVALGLNRRTRVRPIRPGISVGHPEGSTGTIGCIVKRDGQQFILGNNHVLGLLGGAEVGDPVLQPGSNDGGSLLDQVGTLTTFIPIRFLDEPVENEDAAAEHQKPRGCIALLDNLVLAIQNLGRSSNVVSAPIGPPVNYIDAALVEILDTTAVDAEIVDIGGPPLGLTQPELAMKVIKSGRTSGLTRGEVTQFDVTVDVKYSGRPARFANQIMTTPISEPGDSGSLVLDYERNALGLLFSGSEYVTVLNPIQLVLSALGTELVLESGA